MLMLTAASCHREDEGGGGARGKKGGRELVFPVDVMPVVAKKVTYRVNAPGTIDAFETVQVTAKVAGVVDTVAFTEGQVVKQGDLLVVIDSERYKLAASGARAALAKAAAGVRGAQSQVARREGVVAKNPGLIPGEELETFRTQKATASADQGVANESLRTALVNLRDAASTAPIAGVIQTRTVNTGQYVQPGALMATLLRSEPLLLRFRVEPLDAPRLKTGMIVSFTLRESLRTFQAKVTLVAASADPMTHLVPVTAEVIEESHKYWLRPGSFCDVTIDVKAPRSAPVIPRIAVRPTDHGNVVFVIDKDVAKERVVALGQSTADGWVEIRSGLAAGEMLVIRGAEPLSTGSKVKSTMVSGPNLAPDGGPGAADAGAHKAADGGGPAVATGDAGPGAASDAGAAAAAVSDSGELPGQRLITEAGHPISADGTKLRHPGGHGVRHETPAAHADGGAAGGTRAP
jgi:RND family efflux transporter MFP subunit